MNSLNHYAYGSIVEWICRDVAGLAPGAAGFRRAKLAPHICADLGRVEMEYLSAAGTWKTGWKILENGDAFYYCTVPFGCEAELQLSHGGGEFVLTAGKFEKTYTPR